MSIYYQDEHVTLYHGDCIDVLATLPDASVDAVVTDPPYGLEFMGRDWDAPWKPSSIGRGVRVAEQRAAEMTERGKGHSTPGGAFLALRVDSVRVAGKPFQAWCEQWAAQCLRVLKPGGHMVAFGGTRTFHRLTAGIEDAGFEIRDVLTWLYGSGFPKSMDVSKGIDKAAGAKREVVGKVAQPAGNKPGGASLNMSVVGMPESADVTAPATSEAAQWEGWGTALKPAWEPIILARKPLAGTVAGNVLAHGTGALNIDACRIAMTDEDRAVVDNRSGTTQNDDDGLIYRPGINQRVGKFKSNLAGRFPANVLIDDEAGAAIDEQTGTLKSGVLAEHHTRAAKVGGVLGDYGAQPGARGYGDEGGASRFFYSAKAAAAERPVVDGVAHPTVKPLALMEWLIRLVTPPGGTVLEPFAGSGTTLEAAQYTGHPVIGVEKGSEYLPLIVARLERPDPRVRVAKALQVHPDQLDLLEGLGA